MKLNTSFRKLLLTGLIIGASVTAAIVWMTVKQKKMIEMSFSEFLIQCRNGSVRHVTIYSNYMIASISLPRSKKQIDNNQASFQNKDIDSSSNLYKILIDPRYLSFIDEIKNYTVINFKNKQSSRLIQGFMNVLFNLLYLIGMFYLMRKMMRPDLDGSQDGDESYEPDSTTPTLDKVVGFGSIKNDMKNLIKLWIRAIQSSKTQDFILTILFKGEPGTGKTFLANVLAKTTQAKFIKIDVSAIGSPFIHQTSKNIQGQFDKARALAKAGYSVIIFIDEADSVLVPRGSGIGGHSNTEHTEVVTTLLKNISGNRSEAEKKIMVICSTNVDNLDEAFKSRVSQTFDFKMPNLKDRKELINFYMKNEFNDCTWPSDLDLFHKLTEGRSQRDIKTVMLNATVQAKSRCKTLKEEPIVNQEDLFEALISEERSQIYWVGEEFKKSTAMHESGHALVGHFLFFHKFWKLATIALGMTMGKSRRFAGVTFFGTPDFSDLTEEEVNLDTRNNRSSVISSCIVSIAGKIGEMHYFKDNQDTPDSILGWSGDMRQIVEGLSWLYYGGTDINESKKICVKILQKIPGIKKIKITFERKEFTSNVVQSSGKNYLQIVRDKEEKDLHLDLKCSSEEDLIQLINTSVDRDIVNLKVDESDMQLVQFDFFSIVTEFLKRQGEPIDDIKINYFVKNIRMYWLVGNLISAKKIGIFKELSDYCLNRLISHGGVFSNIMNKMIE